MQRAGRFVAGLTATLFLCGAPAAHAAPPDGFTSCKDGGWQTVVGADGRPFANQGACVSYVAHGGTVSAPFGFRPPPVPPLAAAPPQGQVGSPFSLCASNSHLAITQISVIRTSSAETEVDLYGLLDEPVTAGTVSFQLTYAGIPLLNQTLPLGALAQLPALGQTTIQAILDAPGLPSGTYSLTVQPADGTGVALSCSTVSFVV